VTGEGPVAGSYEHGNEPSGSIKGGETKKERRLIKQRKKYTKRTVTRALQ
jgi:hypothetical protein